MRQKYFIPFVFSVLACSQAMAEKPAKTSDGEVKQGVEFVEEKDQGWFFYESLPPEVRERIKKEALAEQEEKKPPVGSSAWFRENLPKLRDQAVDNPTEENIKAYLIMERLAIRKSRKYAEATLNTVLNNPYLDQNSYTPSSVRGARAFQEKLSQNQKRVIDKVRGFIGLYVFFEGGDPVSESMLNELSRFVKSHSMEYLLITMNGQPPQNEYFKHANVTQSKDFEKELGITAPPSVLIYNANEDAFAYLSAGQVHYADFPERVIRVAHSHGWIDEADFQDAIKGYSHPIDKLLDANLDELGDLTGDPYRFNEALENIMGVR